MKRRKRIIFGGIVIMAFSILTGCFSRSYTIGKNPKLEEITSVYLGGGGMDMSSHWSWSAGKSSRTGECELTRDWWDDSEEGMKKVTVSISAGDYDRIIETLEGLRYVKKKTSNNVMDGESTSAQIRWKGSPSGSYGIEFGEKGKAPVLQAMKEVWGWNSYKANQPVDVSRISFFSFYDGPTDIMDGSRLYSAEADEESGAVILRFKDHGIPEDEAEEKSADPSVMNDIGRIIRENQADRWDGFSGDDSMVLDGSAFGLTVITAEGDGISASGREAYPEGYSGFKKAVEELFETYFE